MSLPVIAGFGIGDALRIIAVLQRRRTPQHVLVEAEPYRGAVDVFEALHQHYQITYEQIPRGAWDASPLEARADLECPEALHYTARVASGSLRLDERTFKAPDLPYRIETMLYQMERTGGYVAVQPTTTANKVRQLQHLEAYQPYRVLVGSAADLDGRGRLGPTDLRGMLSIGQTIQVVQRARAVVGVESWVPILGALWGKPVVHQISQRAARDLEPNWSILFPTMGFRIEDE